MIKKSYLYQTKYFVKSYVQFSSIMILLDLVFCILSVFAHNSNGYFLSNGWDLIAMFFTFILGAVSFSENFQMHLQNSVSRKNYFISKILSTLTLCGLFSLTFTVFYLITNTIFNRFNYLSITTFEEIYFSGNRAHTFIDCLLIFVLVFISCVLFFMLGTLISSFFYRVNKAVKIITCVSVPIFLLIVLPAADEYIFGNRIFPAIASFLGKAFGITNGMPWIAVLSFFVMFVIVSALCWLVVRKAPIKSK